MRLPHITLRDPTLDHQVILTFIASLGHVQVSCNCLLVKGKQSQPSYYKPMGTSSNLEQSRQLYNDPANHRKPFTDEDKAKW